MAGTAARGRDSRGSGADCSGGECSVVDGDDVRLPANDDQRFAGRPSIEKPSSGRIAVRIDVKARQPRRSSFRSPERGKGKRLFELDLRKEKAEGRISRLQPTDDRQGMRNVDSRDASRPCGAESALLPARPEPTLVCMARRPLSGPNPSAEGEPQRGRQLSLEPRLPLSNSWGPLHPQLFGVFFAVTRPADPTIRLRT